MKNVGNFNVKFRMIGQYQRCVHDLPQLPGQNGGDDGAVAVQQRDVFHGDPAGHLRREGDSRQIADFIPDIDAGIAHHRVGKPPVLRFGMIGGNDDGFVAAVGELLGIIHHGVSNAVDQGREGVVE